MYSAIPTTPFMLGYLSMIVEPDDKPDLRWYNKLTDRLTELGYSLDGISKGFLVVASARADYYALPLLNTVFRPGFSIDEVVQMISSEVHGERSEVAKDVYVGFVSDESLQDQVRISMWLIFP